MQLPTSLASHALGWLPKGRRGRALAKALLFCVGSIPVRSVYGVVMRADWRDNSCIYSLLGQHGHVAEAVSLIGPGTCFIDVGANAGLFSSMAALRVGPTGVVVAFEPDPSVYARLTENLHLNGVDAVVTPVMAAVGPRSGQARFASGKRDHTGLGHLAESGDLVVRQIGPAELQQLLGPLIGGREVAIKVDVEGAELVVLCALAEWLLPRACVRTVAVEIDDRYLHRFGHQRHGIYDLLEPLGFKPKFGRLIRSRHYDEIFRR